MNEMETTMELFHSCVKQKSHKASQTDDQVESPSKEHEQEPEGNDCVLNSPANSELDVTNDDRLFTSRADSDAGADQSPNSQPSASKNTNMDALQPSDESRKSPKPSRKRKSEPRSGPRSKTRRLDTIDLYDDDFIGNLS